MNVEDYVRTNHYGISKITDIYNEDKIELDKLNAFGIKGVCYSVENIIKSSPNIIDLIEIGDYVNEEKVLEVLIDKNMSRVKTELSTFFNNEIKSIVTKEQFSQMEYKVGE